MDYADEFIHYLLNSAESKKLDLTEEVIKQAKIDSGPEKIANVQESLRRARNIVEPRHMRLIIDSDMNADSICRQDRIALLESWSAKRMFPDSPNDTYLVALDRCLESEIFLSKGELSIHDVLYYRTRSFVYTMIFVLKEYLLPLFLMSKKAIEHACIFALVTVILDDAEDYEEDRTADSPTLFTLYPNDAGVIASHILAFLFTLNDDHSPIEGLSMLSVTPFLHLAVYQLRAYMNLEDKCKTIDTRAFLKMLAEPDIQEKKHWRNQRSHDCL